MNEVTILVDYKPIKFEFATTHNLTTNEMYDLVLNIINKDVDVITPELQKYEIKYVDLSLVESFNDKLLKNVYFLPNEHKFNEIELKIKKYNFNDIPEVTQEIIDKINNYHRKRKQSGKVFLYKPDDYYLVSYDYYLICGKKYFDARLNKDYTKQFNVNKLEEFEFKNIQIINGLPVDLDVITNEIIPKYFRKGKRGYENFVEGCCFELDAENGKILYTYKDNYRLQVEQRWVRINLAHCVDVPFGDVMVTIPEVKEMIYEKIKRQVGQWQEYFKDQN